MVAYEFFVRMGELHEEEKWEELEEHLSLPHDVVPGEKEAFIDLNGQKRTSLELDNSGIHVILKNF